jgi:hypothetical protein
MTFQQILMPLQPKMNYCFEFLRYVTMLYNYLRGYWAVPSTELVQRYFLSDDDEYDDSYTRVPEGAVFVEEWINEDGDKLCYLQYEGEEIVDHENPFELKARCPWVWVGDETSEIDLTRTFSKFLIPGNVIHLDLVEKLIQITEKTTLVYVARGTFEIVKFPGDGILIEEDV